MTFEPSDAVEVRPVEGKGLGVFARRPIRKGEVIERAPLIIIPGPEYLAGVDKSLLAGYVFAWGDGQYALALGFGSLYNHSYRPNAFYEDEEPRTKRYVAFRAIKEGEEVTINYNGNPTSRVKMWFDVAREAKATRPAKKRGPAR